MTRSPLVRAALLPFAGLYGAATAVRGWLYDVGFFPARRLDGIVLSIGNLTAGGTGKTPLVLWMAEELAARGRRVGILIRGYRARQVLPGGPRQSDETWLLGNRLGERVRLGVGANRWAEGRRLEEEGVEVFLLDDGFQHRGLARDVDIVLLDALDPFGGGRLLPAGRLREPRSALGRADVIVITRSEHAPAIEAIVRHHTDAPIFYATTALEEVRLSPNCRAAVDAPAWLGKRVFAFCGTGNPAAFFAEVRGWGMEPVGQMGFPDHHRYSARDVARIEAAAAAAGAEALIATEKDAFNLGEHIFARLPLYHCHVTMRPTDPAGFWNTLDNLVELKRSGG